MAENSNTSMVDQETQAVLAIAEDLQRQLEHSLEMIRALKEDLGLTRDLQKRAEGLADSRARELQLCRTEAGSLQQINERLVIELGASEAERAEAVKEIRRLQGTLENTSETVRVMTEQQQKDAKNADDTRRATEMREARMKAAAAEQEQKVQSLERGLEQRTKDLDLANALIDDLKRDRTALGKRVADLEQSRQALGKIHTSLNDIRSKLLGNEGQRVNKTPDTNG